MWSEGVGGRLAAAIRRRLRRGREAHLIEPPTAACTRLGRKRRGVDGLIAERSVRRRPRRADHDVGAARRVGRPAPAGGAGDGGGGGRAEERRGARRRSGWTKDGSRDFRSTPECRTSCTRGTTRWRWARSLARPLSRRAPGATCGTAAALLGRIVARLDAVSAPLLPSARRRRLGHFEPCPPDPT